MDGFGDIFCIIIVGGSIIWEIVKALKGEAEGIKENFPEIPVPVLEETEDGLARKDANPLQEIQPKPVVPKTFPKESQHKKVLSQRSKKRPNTIGHQLRSTDGARRAFIYSEIFKRKYN